MLNTMWAVFVLEKEDPVQNIDVEGITVVILSGEDYMPPPPIED